MKTAEEWFSEYSETHQNSLNQKIHFVCVPLIFWSVAALLSLIPLPVPGIPGWINATVLVLIPVMIFYFTLGVRYFLSMLVFSGLALYLIALLAKSGVPIGTFALTVFIVAWIGQFYGHKVEGKKPSFFTDLLFLLIGPVWILEKFLRKMF